MIKVILFFCLSFFLSFPLFKHILSQLHAAHWFYRNLESAPAQCGPAKDWLGSPTANLGQCRCPVNGLLMSALFSFLAVFACRHLQPPKPPVCCAPQVASLAHFVPELVLPTCLLNTST